MSLRPCPWMPDTLEQAPAPFQPQSLLVLLHGWGSNAKDMEVLAQALCQAIPGALALAPQGFETAAAQPGARQWFDVNGMTPANRAKRVAQALPRLVQWLRDAQQHTDVPPERTVLAGFSQGASMAVELALAHDGLASRVLAFAGRCATPPERAPQRTVLHFLLGAADPLISAEQAQATVERLRALGGEATLDLAAGLGHGIDAALLDAAARRLA
jgi:phospholipase/carboxylesterase